MKRTARFASSTLQRAPLSHYPRVIAGWAELFRHSGDVDALRLSSLVLKRYLHRLGRGDRDDVAV